MTSVQQSTTPPAANAINAAQTANAIEPSVSGKTSPLAAVPARTYASATKKSVSPSPPAVPNSSTPSVVVGGLAPSQYGKSNSIPPVNGKTNSQIQPAIPAVAAPTTINSNMVNGPTASSDHTRKTSVTINASGASGQLPNGGPVGGSTGRLNISFGSINAGGSPHIAQSVPFHSQTSSLAAPISNPRVTSPTSSPSPIPQPAVTGGRPPTALQGQGNGMTFGGFGENGDVNMRPHSLPQGSVPVGQPPHMRRESSQSMHGEMSNAGHNSNPHRGGYSANGGRGGRAYNQQYSNPQISYSPHQNFRNLPMQQSRGGPAMGPQFQGPYPSSPRGAHRSPVPMTAQPATAQVPHPYMQHQHGGYPQHLGPQQVYTISPSDQLPTLRADTTQATQQSSKNHPAPVASLPKHHPSNTPFHTLTQDLSQQGGLFDQYLTNLRKQGQYAMHPQFDPNFAQYLQQSYGMHPGLYQMAPPPSPRPSFHPTPQAAQYIPGQYNNAGPSQGMSRTPSQMSERPASSVGPASIAPPANSQVSHTPNQAAVMPSSNANFQIPPRQKKKSSAIAITNDKGEVLNFDKTSISPVPTQSIAPVVASSTPTPTPPPQPRSSSVAEPQRARSDSKALKSDADTKRDFQEQVMRQLEAEKAEEQRKKEEADQNEKEEAEAKAAAEKAETEQKAAKEREDAEQTAKEQEDAEKAARDKEEAEEAAKENEEADKAAKEKDDAEKAAKEKEDAEKAAKEKEDADRIQADAQRAAEDAESSTLEAEAKAKAAREEEERLEREIAEMEAREREEEERERAYQEKKAREDKEKAAHDAKIADEELRRAEREAEEAEEARQQQKPVEEEGDEAKAERQSLFASLKKPGFGPGANQPSDDGTATPASDDSMAPPTVKSTSAAKPKPSALKLDTAKPVEPAQPTPGMQALKSARFIQLQSEEVTYPGNIKSPNPALNQGGKRNGRQYDKAFLLQFQDVFKEKPAVDWDIKLKSTVGDSSDSSAPKSARAPVGGLGTRQTSNRGPAAAAFGTMGTFGQPGITLPPNTTSQQRFAIASGAQPRPTMNNPLASFSRPPGAFPMGGQPLTSRTSSSLAMGSSSTHLTRTGNGSKRGNRPSGRGSDKPTSKHEDAQMAKAMPLTAGAEVKPLKPSESSWKPLSFAAGPGAGATDPSGHMPPDMVQRKVKAALNKMTPEKFDKISDQILAIAGQSRYETDGRTMRQVIQLTFEKATDEAHWASMYAKFCTRMLETMSTDIKDENVKDKAGNPVVGGALFRKYLLNRCQEEFERGWQINLPENKQGETEEAAMLSDEYYIAAAAKRRGLGLIQFIGELYKLGMLTMKIMHQCFLRLLDFKGTPDEAAIESLTRLLKTVGSTMDQDEKGSSMLQVYFERINQLVDLPDLPSRMRFMLMDVIDLRKNKWRSKDDAKGPKTIQEIHNEASIQQQQAEADKARQNQRGPGGRPPQGRGDARGASYGMPPPEYNRNHVGMDDLRRLGARATSRQASAGPGSLGPASMMASRSSSGRNRLAPAAAMRATEASGASSRTGTPPVQTQETSTSANAFSALATLGDGSGEHHDESNAASPPTSPPTTKAEPATAPAAADSATGGGDGKDESKA